MFRLTIYIMRTLIVPFFALLFLFTDVSAGLAIPPARPRHRKSSSHHTRHIAQHHKAAARHWGAYPHTISRHQGYRLAFVQQQDRPVAQSDTLINLVDSALNVQSLAYVPTVPEDLLRERFAGLQKKIPLTYSKLTHTYVDLYTFRKTAYTQHMLEKMSLFFPMYERTLAKYGLPDELKFLSMVESALNPKAVSHAGAVGLWQFMPVTGSEHQLYQDEFIDERMDPEKSTEAACRYLRNLYRNFGDWELALAAYNSGPGTVRRALRRSGGTTFWDAFEYLPKETRSYVPLFVAVTYMMHYGNDHGIFAEQPQYPIPFDTLHINSYFALDRFAKYGNVPLAELQQLNPALTSTVLPPDTRQFVLRVPSDQFHYIQTHRRMVMDSATKMPTAMPHTLLADTETILPAESTEIADLRDESPLLLLANLTTEPVLEQPTSTEPVNTLPAVIGMGSVTSKPVISPLAAVVQEKLVTKPKKVIHQPRYHIVGDGDTLWNISHRYGNIPIDRLKKLNGIKGNDLKPGQKLIVG